MFLRNKSENHFLFAVVAYDIEDTKIRNQLARFLEKKGKRIQKSVFLMDLKQHTLTGCMKSMEKITKGEGDVILFPLCSGCQQKALMRIFRCNQPIK